jgi:hypothetical protein
MDFFNISLPRITFPSIPIPTGLPLRLIAFQCLFLALAIAIEAAILQRGLEIKPKRSVEYATAINLLSMVVSWVLFLNIQPILPEQLRLELIAGVLFDQWAGAITSWMIVVALIIFFLSWVMKVIGLTQLQLFLGDRTLEESRPTATLKQRTLSRKDKDFRGLPNQASILLIANAISSSAIFLVIVLRLLAQSTLGAPLL